MLRINFTSILKKLLLKSSPNAFWLKKKARVYQLVSRDTQREKASRVSKRQGLKAHRGVRPRPGGEMGHPKAGDIVARLQSKILFPSTSKHVL